MSKLKWAEEKPLWQIPHKFKDGGPCCCSAGYRICATCKTCESISCHGETVERDLQLDRLAEEI